MNNYRIQPWSWGNKRESLGYQNLGALRRDFTQLIFESLLRGVTVRVGGTIQLVLRPLRRCGVPGARTRERDMANRISTS